MDWHWLSFGSQGAGGWVGVGTHLLSLGLSTPGHFSFSLRSLLENNWTCFCIVFRITISVLSFLFFFTFGVPVVILFSEGRL